MTHKKWPIALLLAGVTSPLLAAEPYAEVRGYPAGVIASVGVLLPLDARTDWGASLLYNHAERGNNGEHDDESGDGGGVGLELRRFYGTQRSAWFYGVRAELFRIDIDWQDPGRSGSSKTTVLQPTARAGYRLPSAIAGTAVEFTLGLGAEINLSTQGEQVGDGAIGLAGITLLLP